MPTIHSHGQVRQQVPQAVANATVGEREGGR
jgi:hypothetical protein